jgi:hypothetical protein
MSTHLAAIAISGGLILVTDLRLLGIALGKYRVSDIIDGFRWPKRVGFLVVATCGIMMLGSKAEEYYYNAFVWAKFSLLACVGIHALVFRPTVYNTAAKLDGLAEMPARAKAAGALSMLLWVGIACMGRGIGYIETPVEKIHALLTAPGFLR